MKKIFDRVSGWKGKSDEDSVHRQGANKAALQAAQNISLASQLLYDCIHSVLSNGAALRGDDMSGFTTLLELLNSSPPEDLNQWRLGYNSNGFLEVLLEYKDHPEFIEICNQRNLSEALINALRLLRMLEIKQGGGGSRETTPLPVSEAKNIHTDADASSYRGVTYNVSLQICEIFKTLCTSIQTVEKMRPNLTKLFSLTLQNFPLSGLHLQRHVADVIATLCKRSLSSQIVWFLHDSQAIKFMVRSFQELVYIENAAQTTNTSSAKVSNMLKGMQAEERELWLVALESFGNVLISSYQFSSVLLGDFEAAEGVPLFVHVIVNSRGDRCMKTITVLFNLLAGEFGTREEGHPTSTTALKSSEASKVALIFKGILNTLLQLNQPIQGDEAVEQLIEISSSIFEKSVDLWRMKEGEKILQSMAFGFLTLCSSHIEMYIMLEQTHHLLATIVLCLPSFQSFESLVAVTKTLLFVGGEGRPSFEIITLCASVAVMLRNLFRIDIENSIAADNSSLISNLSFVLNVFEEVLNGDSKHCVIFSCCGLKHMVCEPLKVISNDGITAGAAEVCVPSMDIFQMLIRLVCTSLKHCPSAVMSEVKSSGVLELCSDVFISQRYKAEDGFKFLDLHMCIMECNQEIELDYLFGNICALINRLLIERLYYKIVFLLKKLEAAFTICSQSLRSFSVFKAWQLARGFECLIQVLSSMKDSFSSANDQTASNESFSVVKNSILLECLKCVFALLSACLTDPSDNYMFSYQKKSNREYFKVKVKYASVSKALFESGVLSTSHVEEIIYLALSLVSGRQLQAGEGSHVSNPEGMHVVVDMLKHLRVDLAKVAMALIEQTASGQIDGSQVLVEAGISRYILKSYSAVLLNIDDPLRENLLQLLLKLCSEHLILGDFAAILKTLVRPEVIMSSESNMLLPPWQCVDDSGTILGRSWNGIKIMNTLLKQAVRHQGAAFVSIGPAAAYRHGESAYLATTWSDSTMGRPFPVYGHTVSAWFQIEENLAMKMRFSSGGGISAGGHLLPLFAAVSNSMGVFLELQIDVQTSMGRLIYRKNKGVSVAIFNVPYISEGDWHLCNITIKRPKRLIAVKTQIVVLLDGQAVYSDLVDMEFPTAGSVQSLVGKKIYGSVDSSWFMNREIDISILEDLQLASSDAQAAVGLWRLGPFCLFDECLSQHQISNILTKGPAYHGSFQGESPLTDLIPTVVTQALSKSNSTLANLGAQLDSMGLRSFESVVIPMVDNSGEGHIAVNVELPTLPAPVLVYSGVSFVRNNTLSQSSSSPTKNASTTPAPPLKRRVSGAVPPSSSQLINDARGVESFNTGAAKLLLNNLTEDGIDPQAELCCGFHVSRVESVSRCISAIGGPIMLMPLVQSASTESQLLMSLSLLRNATRNDASNMKYMQTGGYQLLSFLLTLKPKYLITEAVVEALFQFSIDKGSYFQPEKAPHSNDFRSLLVDTQALYYLILNHQVWGADRYVMAVVVVDLLRSLVSEDAHHAQINAKRLSLLGVGRWLLLLMVYGVNKSVNTKDMAEMERTIKESKKVGLDSDGEKNDVLWNITCMSPADVAARRDSVDPFLIAVLSVVRPILMCRLRNKDVDLVTQLIINSIYSFDDLSMVESSSSSIEQRAHRMLNSVNLVSGKNVAIPHAGSVGDQFADMRSAEPTSRYELTPVAMMRLALIRFMREIYCNKADTASAGFVSSLENIDTPSDQHAMPEVEIRHMFGKSLTPSWFLTCLEKTTDFATNAALLRLLVMQMQHDSQFRRAFTAAEGMSYLQRSMIDECKHIAVVLPLISLFLNISISKMPMPVSGSELATVHLIGESAGPTLMTPDVSDIFVPTFNILMGIYAAHARNKPLDNSVNHLNEDDPTSPVELIRAVITHCSVNCPAFREFMQSRSAITTTVSALLQCSDAMEDFGSRILLNRKEGQSFNLSSALNESYLDGSTGELRSRDRGTDLGEDVGSGDAKADLFANCTNSINLVVPEGTSLLNLIRSVISDSIKTFQNPQVIAYLLLVFPKLVSSHYLADLHKLIIAQLVIVTKSIFVDANLEYLAVASKMFLFIVPIAKARLLDDVALFELVHLIYNLLDMLSLLESHFSQESEKFMTLRRDFSAAGRYFSIMSLCAMRSSERSPTFANLKVSVLQLIRSHLLILYHALDETEAPSPLRLKRDQTPDDIARGIPVLESFQLNVYGNEQVSTSLLATAMSKRNAFFNTTLSLAQAEIWKISVSFSPSLYFLLHPLLLDDDTRLRNESLRIMAGIFHYRRALMVNVLQVFSREVSSDASLAVDISPVDGYAKLLPTNVKVLQSNLRQYAGVAAVQQRDQDEGEDLRFAEFMDWLSSGSFKYEIVLQSLENSLSNLFPSVHNVSDVIKRVQGGQPTNDLTVETNASNAVDISTYISSSSRLISAVHNEMIQWSLCGVSDSAAGAKLWSTGWMTLQCSPIWGVLPLSSSVKLTGPKSDRIGWQLGYLEGPERVRLRMEEDFGNSQADDFVFPKAVDSNEKINLRSSTAKLEDGPLIDTGSTSVLEPSDPSGIVPNPNFQAIIEQIQKSGGFRRHSSFGETPSSPKNDSVIAEVVDADDFFIEENSMNVECTGPSDEGSPARSAFPKSPDSIDVETEEMDHVSKTPAKQNFGFAGDEYEDYFEITPSRQMDGVTEQERDDIVTMDNPTDELKNEEIILESEPRREKDIFTDIDRGFDRFKEGVVTRMSSLAKMGAELEANSPISNRKISLRFKSNSPSNVLGPPILDGPGSSAVSRLRREHESLKKIMSGSDNNTVSDNFSNSDATSLPYLGSNTRPNKNPYEMEEATRKFHLLNEIMKGMIGAHEWTSGQTLNVDRIFGLESHPALLVLTPKYIHLLDGFQLIQKAGAPDRLIEWTSLTGKINVTTSFTAPSSLSQCKREESKGSVSELPWIAGGVEEMSWLKQIWRQFLRDDIGYFRIPIDQVYSVFRRRYQLQEKALEITDTRGFSLLFACKSKIECEALLRRMMEMDMVNSMFKIAGLNNIQLGVGLFTYKRVIGYYISYVQKLWLKGCISNFEYLMHLNTAAGRSFQDLTQYPVFPWILADYTSSELDLNNSRTFRDLSKPMGALGEKRAAQYRDRYTTMKELMLDEQDEALFRDSIGGGRESSAFHSTPPFFYGTHYSCAGYVLHYLLRLQPFASMSVALQGGQFDKPDRLFRSIGQSWLSASRDNLQDVRELIPEFFCLPDFLLNLNNFSFGVTQRGEKIDNVILPPWANNDPAEFIRKHREALESRYVSENLHNWIDLIFGYKQLGREAEDSMNLFIHLTYEGEVDVDTITDPVMRDATISQINNFGQTPTRLFSKPHPKKHIPVAWRPNPQNEGQLIVDSDAINNFVPMSPPFCVVGEPQLTDISKVYFGQVSFPVQMTPRVTGPIGDLRMLTRDKLVVVPTGCTLLPPKFTRYAKFWKSSGGISFHSSQPTMRLDLERDVEVFESLHSRPVSCVATSIDGSLFVTGSEDRSVRLWAMPKAGSNSRRLSHLATLSGHSGSVICLDLSIALNIAVSGSADKSAMIWDIRNMKLLHVLGTFQSPVISVSINKLCGNVAALSNDRLAIFDINGSCICSFSPSDSIFGGKLGLPNSQMTSTEKTIHQVFPGYLSALKSQPRVVVAPPAADWQDGVVAITGHEGGHVFLWRILNESVSGSRNRKVVTNEEDETGEVIRVRKILVPHSTMRTHRADICVMRLCYWNVPKLKPLIPRHFEGENGLELLIGDVDGYVSRWDASRLDQMTTKEITTLTSRHQALNGVFRGSSAFSDSASYADITNQAPSGAATPVISFNDDEYSSKET